MVMLRTLKCRECETEILMIWLTNISTLCRSPTERRAEYDSENRDDPWRLSVCLLGLGYKKGTQKAYQG